MSLRLKFLIPLIIACLASAAYIGLVWSPAAIKTGQRQYLNDVSAHLDTAIEGLTPLMLSNQLDLIQKNLTELQKTNREWMYIRLTNSEGKWLYPLMLKDTDKLPLPGAGVQVLEKDINYLGRPVGRLVIYVDLAPRVAKMRLQQRQLAEILLAVIVLFALALVGMLELTMIRPLRQLSVATAELARHHFGVPLPQRRRDEIGALIGNFSTMRGELKTYRESLIHEVEERRQREQELKRYKAIIDSSDDAIISKTLGGIITSWNPGAERMFGYTAEETVGKSIFLLVPDDRSQEENEIIALANQGRKVDHFETVRLHKDGRPIDVSASISPILDEVGRLVGVSSIARDVSDQKRMAAEQQAIRRQLEAQLEQISELQIRLQEQVIHDPLTGMFNRRYLDETMPRELAMAKREGYLLSVVMLDLDHFKRVNDTYGHAAGDEVLQAVADILKSKGRESDIICRYGGEEFVVVLPRMSPRQAMVRVEEWRLALMETQIRHGDLGISITMSAGIAGYPEDGSDPDTLIAHADEALYHSKNAGRNRVTCFQDMQQPGPETGLSDAG